MLALSGIGINLFQLSKEYKNQPKIPKTTNRSELVLTGNLVSSVFQKLTAPKVEVDVLYYNRMTKCAGEYMLELMKRLKNRNRFILLNEIKTGQKHYFLGDEAEERWAANIKRQVDTQFEQDWHTKLVVSRHQYFLDLKGFFWEPQYKNHTFALINLVRHPIAGLQLM